MNSFYGGMNGQSFSLVHIFNNRVELDKDLSRAWNSPISVGDFVEISYGMPNDVTSTPGSGEPLTEFEKNQLIDIEHYNGKTYNSTLWQKCYNKVNGVDSEGIYYRLITSMTGNTPRLDFNYHLIGANKDPKVYLQNPNDVDHPIIHFELPAHWNIQNRLLEPENLPSLIMITEDAFDEPLEFPYLLLSLPRAWGFDFNDTSSEERTPGVYGDFEILNANQKPYFRIEKQPTGDSPTITFKIGLPLVERLRVLLGDPLEAGEEPTFEYDNSSDQEHINSPTITFHMPKASVMTLADYTVLGPAEEPYVEDLASDENPILHFGLPRAVKFVYGEQLGEGRDYVGVTHSDFNGMLEKDCYVNIATGRIYEVDGVTKDGEYSFKFTACLQAPSPDVTATGISPYYVPEGSTDLGPQPPAAIKTFNDATQEWEIEFSLPEAPLPSVSSSFVGSEEREEADVQVSLKNEWTINYDFTIPVGARIYNGTDLTDETMDSFIVEGILAGDYYLNVEREGLQSGNLYRWTGEEWAKAGTLKGATGEWHVIKNYDVYETDMNDELEPIGEMIENDLGRIPYNFELLSVTYHLTQGDSRSYWYFHTGLPEEGSWARTLLTAEVSSWIEEEYTEGEDFKVYNVPYINSLIGGEVTEENKSKTTYSKEQIDSFFGQIVTWGKISDLLAAAPSTEPDGNNEDTNEEEVES